MGFDGDSESGPVPTPPDGDPWRLPDIVAVEISRVRYLHPRVHISRGKVIEVAEAVEILIRTSAPIAVRALSAALHIGEVEIAENEPEGPQSYRFLLFGDEEPRPGTPIALGWVGQKRGSAPSHFRYRVPATVVERDPYAGRARGDLAPEHRIRKQASTLPRKRS